VRKSPFTTTMYCGAEPSYVEPMSFTALL